jgi:DNA-binding transcriptional LysR family regulator
MNLDCIESFLYVYRTKSFQKAADALFISQSTLSARIKVLEEDIGVRLFNRNKSGAFLTPDGERFLSYALKLTDTYKKAKAEFCPGSKDFTIGCLRTLSENLLPGILCKFKHSYPSFVVHSFIGRTEKLVQDTLEGNCAFAFIAFTQQLKHPNLESIPIFDEPIYLVVPPGHYFMTRSSPITLEEIAYEPLLMQFNPVPNYWIRLEQYFAERSLNPNVTFCADSMLALIAMVKRGLGISFVPGIMIQQNLKEGTLHALTNFSSEIKLYRQISCIYQKGNAPPHMDFFVNEFQQAIQSLR